MSKNNLSNNQKILFDDYMQRTIASSGFPNYIVIETTNSCNLQCIMCPRPQMTRKIGFMELGLFKKIIDEIEGKTEFIYLHFFGEPLLHNKLVEFIDYAAGKGMTVALSTNATFLNSDIADRLLASKLDMLILSIDSIDEDTYKKIRVNGDYTLTMNQIEDFLQKYSVRKPTLNVSLQLIKMWLNEDEVEQFKQRWALKSGISTVVKGLHNYASQVEDIGSLGFNNHKLIQKRCCVENWRSIVIGWDGIVVPCCNDYDYKYPLGDVRNNTIGEIWNSQEMKKLRTAQVEGRQSEVDLCKGCSIPQEEKQKGQSILSSFNPSMLESQAYFNKGLFYEKATLYAAREFELLIQDRFNDVIIKFGKVSSTYDGIELKIRLFDQEVGVFRVDSDSELSLKTPEKFKGRLLRYGFQIIGDNLSGGSIRLNDGNNYWLRIVSISNSNKTNISHHGQLSNKMKSIRDKFVRLFPTSTKKDLSIATPESVEQNLEPYWDTNFINGLETWGEGNAWEEVKFLISGCTGRVLDIACGTGKVMELLAPFSQVELFGCDISDILIDKALERGLPSDNLVVADATKMHYADDFFDYSYSIGSLEHFTESGINHFISECYRVTKRNSFHLLPVSKSGNNEGWMTTIQSFHNNSIEWWLDKFKQFYSDVIVLNSHWHDDISDGKWFICIKR